MPGKFPIKLRDTAGFKKMKLQMSAIKITKDGATIRKGGAATKRGTLQRAHEVLVKNGISQPFATPNRTNTNRYAEELMAAMGYTVEIQQQGYTLVDSQIDFEPVEGFAQAIPEEFLNNHAIEMIKSFPNPCDPIYTPDERMPSDFQGNVTYTSREKAENLDLVCVANIFSATGLTNTPRRTTSKYFENSTVNSALKATNR